MRKLLILADWSDLTPANLAAKVAALHAMDQWGDGNLEIFVRCYGGTVNGQIHPDAWHLNGFAQTPYLELLAPFAGRCILYGGFGVPDLFAGLPVSVAWHYMQGFSYPARQLKAAMAFDASANAQAGSVQWAMLQRLKQEGVTIYVESNPQVGSATVGENWCAGAGWEYDVLAGLDAADPKWAWAQPLNECPGRRIVLTGSPPSQYANLSGNPAAWYQKVMADLMPRGFDVACCVDVFLASGVTRASLGV